ncbi:MAG: hypothetical protein GY947_05705 [Rhodobacteraceae bacterium]|nr:hypothetical protein [Paracoccaceae bacterium]
MKQAKHFWRRTPPALFPSLLGLFGLALAWRRAARIWEVPTAVGEMIGLLATLILLFTLTCYLAKLMLRPTVLWDDLQIGPARGAVSAGSMCTMALAAYLYPFSPSGAELIWLLSLLLHGIYVAAIILILVRHDDPISEVSPVFVLPFAGALIATLIGPDLGYRDASVVIVLASIPITMVILILAVWNAWQHGVLPAQRSAFAATQAPMAVCALGAFSLWGDTYYLMFWLGSTLAAAVLVPFFRWMTLGGWNPGWGAFTFPLSAFSAVQITAVSLGYGIVAQVLAIVSLGSATVFVPYIVFRTYLCWGRGHLAELTKAATA